MNAVEALNRVVVTVLVVDLADGGLRAEEVADDPVKDELAELSPVLVFVRVVDDLRRSAEGPGSCITVNCAELCITKRKRWEVAKKKILN